MSATGDIGLDPEQILLRDNIRRFMGREVTPHVATHDAAKTFPFELLGQLAPFGYLGGWLPEAAGGLGIDYPTWAMMMEEAGYHWSSLRTLLNTHNMPMLLLANHATVEQKQRFLEPLFAGTRQVFSAITEPDVGSNVAGTSVAPRSSPPTCRSRTGPKCWAANGSPARCSTVSRTTSAS